MTEVAAAKKAEGVASSVIGKLGQLLLQEYLLLSSVRGEVVDLRDDAAMMNALLRMLSETDDGAVGHSVREWMKQVRELSYDAEDCIDIFVRRISWASWVAGQGSFGRFWHRIVTLLPRHRLATDIKALRARAIAISDRRARYGVNGQTLRPSVAFGARVVVVPPSSTPLLLSIAHDDPTQFVGLEAQVASLSKKLTSGGAGQALKVYSIVGFGGVGKTTLAVGVCRHLKAAFPRQAIVSVSQQFDASKDQDGLLWSILSQVEVKEYNSDEHYTALDVAGKIERNLAGNRCLIVMDDVWTVSAWNAIKRMLPTNNVSSRVIVTTRSQAVAEQCSTNVEYIHKAEPLDMKDSEKLFIRRVFGRSLPAPSNPTGASSSAAPPASPVPKDLQDEMHKILKKCGGLPLAIVSIASVLASYTSASSLELWTRVSSSIGSQLESNPTLEGVMQIMALSYNHLPHHLKACALYLSIFPEDYMIHKPRLLRRWISEGLIPEKRGLTLQEVAEAYYDELLSRNVIQPGMAINGTVRHCRVHDIMFEVILSKSLEENFVRLVGSPSGGTSSYDPVRRLSIHRNMGHDAEAMSKQHVRSLSSFCETINQDPGKLLDQLANFTLLRVLDLEDCKDVENRHMKQVCRLYLLSFLNLNETDITVLPSEISNLQHLQTLWLYDTLLKEVPGSVVNLTKLEDISFSNRDDYQIYLTLPQGIEKMEALQVLDRLELSKDDIRLAEEIGKLVKLRVLGIVFPKDCNETVLQELARSIDSISSLREFCIEEIPARPAPTGQVPAITANNNNNNNNNNNKMDFLHKFESPPHLLQYLLIDGKIDKFPSWMESLTQLVHIELRSINLQSSQIYGALYMLPSLLKITLGYGCCIDVQLVAESSYKFPVLKELAIIEDDDTQIDVKFEEGAMEKLEILTLSFYNEKNVEGVENLTSLKEVELRCRGPNEAVDGAMNYLNDQNQKLKVIVKYE